MRKTINFLTLFSLGIIFIACNEPKKIEEQAPAKDISKIEVLDFHSTHRCMTCNAIEANTKYTLDTYFSKEMANNRITFQTINVDDVENEAMAIKFEAAGTALVLNVIKDGKETQIDLTDFAFMNGNDQEVFSKALKAKLETALKSI
ncbi:hypothetical protein DNU06_06415 [Putridiphycobacter roseus]|uniref:Thioredoxin domain-containing protein n=1 Tax=Putridiphycobacter roseus TaxID=2219161 RepID=A0A2W1NS27_9FLAO|nr:nitrophenyl compound nitroreductase subunit ArsF family protein [Putridiphycobacter roseus]PZE17458.1 hypothetical protein DNU06_06415 [Putridiphycobacter roseus]